MKLLLTQKLQALTCSFFLFFSLTVQGQSTFDKVFDNQSGLEIGYSIIAKNDSEYINLTVSLDLNFGKHSYVFFDFNDQGDLLLQKDHVDIYHDLYIGLSGSLKRANATELIFGGGAIDTVGNVDGLIVKLNDNGDTLYQKFIGTSVDWENFYNSAITSWGEYLFIGQFGLQGMTTGDYYLVKTDTNGNILLQKTYGDSMNEIGTHIDELPGKKLLITGLIVYPGYEVHPWVLITDSAGNIINQKEFYQFKWRSASLFTSCVTASDGNFFMQGVYRKFIIPCNEDVYIGFVAKLDTNFNVKWRTEFVDTLSSFTYTIKELPDSSIVGVGYRAGSCNGGTLGWIFKLDKNGNQVWEKTFQHDTSNYAFNIFADFQQTKDKGFIICGGTLGPITQDLWLVKLDSTGYLAPDTINTGTIEVTDEYATMSVYPNPCTNEAHIIYNIPVRLQEGILSLYNLTGQRVEQQIISSQQHSATLELNNLPAGLYLVELKTAEGILTKKLLKQ